MRTRTWSCALAGAAALVTGIAAHAITTAGSGTVIVFPVVASTTSYSTEVFVGHALSTSVTVNVKFYEAKTSSTPGLKTCTPVTIPTATVQSFGLGAQCAGLLDPTKNHHGMLILEDAAEQKVNYFFAYSRTQTPGGNGFSVEGYPVGNFSGAVSRVYGLKRQAAAPIYQSNCFVGALGEAVDYKIDLYDGATGAAIGSPVTGSLAPYEINRHLDVFAAAAAPAGDYSNVRANFNNTNAGDPAYVAFCTVQESTFFGADFRIAKSVDALDTRQKRLNCYSQDTCGTVTTSNPAQVTDVANKIIHQFQIAQPDYVRCELVGDRVADLQMRLRGPGDPLTAPVFATSPPYDGGGTNKTSFYVFTGHRNAVTAGQTARWAIDVSFRTGGNATVPIPYGITCTSGNGITVPWYRGSAAKDF
jgi:hypothetical protein